MQIQVLRRVDYEMEAIALLERVYETAHPKKPEDDYLRHLASITERYPDMTDFAKERLTNVYTAACKDLPVSEKEMETYFTVDRLKIISMARALAIINSHLAGKKAESILLMTLIAGIVTNEWMAEDVLDGSMESFAKVIEKNTEDGEAAWTCIDLYLHFHEHIKNLKGILQPVIQRLKAFEIEFHEMLDHYFSPDYCKEAARQLPGVGITLEGIVKVKPSFFAFNTLNLESNDEMAALCGEPKCTVVALGMLVLRLYYAKESDTKEQEALGRHFRTLNDKTRLKILAALKDGPKFTKDLIALTGISAATMSHHMSELLSDRLITLEKKGTSTLYRLCPETVEGFIELVRAVLLD